MSNEDITLRAPEQDVVVSSRVRLARNYADTPFSPKMDAVLAQRTIDRVVTAMEQTPEAGEYRCLRMKDLSPARRKQLVEHHLISYDLLKYVDWSAALISSGETVSIMVNEEDHLRIQGLLRGLQLQRAAELAFRVDDQLCAHGEFAFDPQWGYLTSCPTNTGTGVRASTLLHLPALSAAGQLSQIVQAIAKLGMTVRGLYGEGSDALGCMYQLSNQVTLGRTEEDIIRSLIAATLQITGHERAVRVSMMAEDERGTSDKLMRSVGILKYARVMTVGELMPRMSDLRLAVALDLVDYPMSGVDNLMTDLQDGSLATRAGEDKDEKALSVLRADILREALKDL